MDLPLLEISALSCSVESGQPLFQDINFTVNEGEIVLLQGKSGCGKTTLLKCIAHLALHEGEVRYRGRTPQEIGIPKFRTGVLYVPQRPSLLPGSPRDFLRAVSSLSAHKFKSAQSHTESKTSFIRALEISEAWGLNPDIWEREWSSLSGGEGQRLVLAAALALESAEILLLDEPTSALDAETSLTVERYLVNEVESVEKKLRALMWITHSEEQGKRVGKRFIHLNAGGCFEEYSHV